MTAEAMTEQRIFRPQPGPQERFIRSPADIVIYGGAAGGGKSFALLFDPTRSVHNPQFGAVIFRRVENDILKEGGLWDESEQLYPFLGAIPNKQDLTWRFPSGAKIAFAHLQHEKHKFSWQGAQVPYIGFDEGTHFTEGQFWYMTSRNRSPHGIKTYVRLTCNPDPDSFVFQLVSWYIDEKTGLPISERSGKIRWFLRPGDDLVWAESRQELVDRYGPKSKPRSFTFISATLDDNPILQAKDPEYEATLMALPRIDRERLKFGNWNIRSGAGMYFRRDFFEIVDAAPAGIRSIRYWDRAATLPTPESPDPDWTAGLKISRDSTGIFYIENVNRFRGTPATVEQKVKNTASQDGTGVQIGIEQDPGSAGKSEASYYLRALAGYIVKAFPATKDKVTRAKPAISQAEAGNIKIVRGPWNEEFLRELENFPDGAHDDQVDALSGGVNALTAPRKIMVA